MSTCQKSHIELFFLIMIVLGILSVYIVLVLSTVQTQTGILYPRLSKTREIHSLDGLWKFSLSKEGEFDSEGLTENDRDLQLMPVPSSYNDIPTTFNAREHVGPVKYERTFIVPPSWRINSKVWLRFGSVCYSAEVFINNKLALSHEIGHLPFVGDITSFLIDEENLITVIVDNILTGTTIPQGKVETLPGGRRKQQYNFDFFNFAGIDRSVLLYRTAVAYIDDITIETTIEGQTGLINYNIDVKGGSITSYTVSILDKYKKIVTSNDKLKNVLKIPNANLWWPYLMSKNPGYLYTLRVEIFDKNNLVDHYDQPFGIRELYWDNNSFKINGKPIYLRGFGKHEDSDIRGKGLDLPTIIRDHNLIKWIGANSYRTSHYPYAEEIMDLADELGIMIIDEVPAVNTDNFNNALLENHKRSLTELYKRDKNRPSVVIWSVANEPRTQKLESDNYYKHIVSHIKSFDKTRPVTIVNMYTSNKDHAGKYFDILSFNRYESWYSYDGDLDVIVPNLLEIAIDWHKKHNKPVLLTEYGADTLEGYHSLPEFIWSEEYQTALISEHFKTFDQLRKMGWFIGEMIWNFADFRTGQDHTRVGGNKKGIFTRQRQPKASAHLIRRRYWELAVTLDNATLPNNLDGYVIKNKILRDEL